MSQLIDMTEDVISILTPVLSPVSTPKGVTIEQVEKLEENLQQDLFQSLQSPLKKVKPASEASKRLPQKEDLVSKIVDIEKKLKETDPTYKHTAPSVLRKYSVARLEAKLGELLNQGIGEIVSNVSKGVNIEEEVPPSQISIAYGLFRLNHTAAIISEILIGKFTEFSIKGYAQEIDSNQSELLKYYQAIAKEYEEVLGKYISPINMILMINITSAAKHFECGIDETQVFED